MEKGCHIVSKSNDNEYDIVFAVKPDTGQVSELQQKLHLEVERTLVVVRKLFEDSPNELTGYFLQLLSLAQAGLVPDNAQPAIALNALKQLKSEIVDLKSGEIKNSYFKLLGITGIKLGILPLLVGLLLKFLNFYYPKDVTIANLSTFANFLFLWSSTLLGIWISFGARKTILAFEELTTIEEDRLEPLMRMLFTGAISLVFSLLFYKEALTISFGSISTKEVGDDVFIAMIFGIALGLSEQILGKKIIKKAASLFDNI